MWTLGRVDSTAASPAKQLPVGSTDTRVRIRAWPPQGVYSQGGSGRDSNSPSSAAHLLPLPTAILRGEWGGTMDSLAKTIWKAEWGFQLFHETKMKFSGPQWGKDSGKSFKFSDAHPREPGSIKRETEPYQSRDPVHNQYERGHSKSLSNTSLFCVWLLEC